MRTSLKKLRGLYKHGNKENKEQRDLRNLPELDEISQASQDLADMRDCYDSLLSAAAATVNSSYEFSESLREMGACLLEKTALNDDEDSGRVLLMLGKVQYEIQKFVDAYRSNISRTITVPSESLLNELRTVEEMKRRCDEKRKVYEYVKARGRDKGRPRSGKGESYTAQHLEVARDEYDQEATLFIFRLKSLKQGQSRSLLTQAARHHAAQLCFFRKACNSLDAVEPELKSVTEQHHIEYQLGELRNDDTDDCDEYGSDDDDDDSDSNDAGELSFDYAQNDQGRDVPIPTYSMEVDQVDLTFPKVRKAEDHHHHKIGSSFPVIMTTSAKKPISQSAPITAESENKADLGEKLRRSPPSLTRKFHSYVLPTPLDPKGPAIGSGNPTAQSSLSERTQNLWHSSPLEPKMYDKTLKESNHPRPPPSYLRYDNHMGGSDPKKIKRQAFSGPITSKPWPAKHPQLFSGPLLRNPQPQIASSSPKISELHELPRPPSNAYSGPLLQSSSKQPAKPPLPKPPRSLSTPFSRPVGDLHLVSPPLSPITLSND